MAAALGIGTATFLPDYGPTAAGRPAPALLASAFECGVRYVDTAAAYGGSEAAIGELAGAVQALDVRVATKLQHTGDADACRAAMKSSLNQLGLPAVDTVLMHSASGSLLASPDVARAWTGLRERGLAKRIGASTYGIADARMAAALDWCDTVQLEFSIVNQSVVRAIRSKKSRPVEVVARSVLCKGLLTPAAFGLGLPDDARATLRALETVARSADLDLTTLAIRFALDTDGIDVVLVGVSDQAELDVAVRAWRRPPLSPRQYEAVAAFDRSDADWSHPERWPGGRPAA